MTFPIPPSAEYIRACGSTNCLDLLCRCAELRSVPKLHCSTETAPLLEALAGPQPPDGVILCLPDPDGLELARNIRRTYPQVRVVCVTQMERLLEDCPLGYEYIPLPPPVTEVTCRQALSWLGYPPPPTERHTVHLWLIGQTTEALQERLGRLPDVQIHRAFYTLDAIGALNQGTPCDLWVLLTEAGDGPGMQEVQHRDSRIPLFLVGQRPLPSTYAMIKTKVQSIWNRRCYELPFAVEKEEIP